MIPEEAALTLRAIGITPQMIVDYLDDLIPHESPAFKDDSLLSIMKLLQEGGWTPEDFDQYVHTILEDAGHDPAIDLPVN